MNAIGTRLGCALTGAVWALLACGVAGGEPARSFTLENGACVIIVPVGGTKSVGLETIYRVGFIDEPEGLPQAAHLLEHVVCRGATASFKAGESFEELSRGGLANAETMATFTHYDFVFPPERLEYAMRVEAERIGSLRIDGAIVAQEGPRAAEEVAVVSRAPQAPVFKFAVMAANQVWRYGAKSVSLREGLDRADPEKLRALHAASYRAANLTMVLTGAVNPGDAEALVRKHLGALAGGRPPARAAIAWETMAAETTATWDCAVPAVVLAMAPPAGVGERGAISLWCESIYPRLMQDAELATVAQGVFMTNSMWPAGDLPVMFCVSVRDGKTGAEAAKVLGERVLALAQAPVGGAQVLKQGAEGLAMPAADLMAMFERQLAGGAGFPAGMNPEHAVLGNGALQIGTRWLITGADPAGWAREAKAAIDRLPEIIKATVNRERFRAVILKPR